MIDTQSIQERVIDYLRRWMPGARDLVLSDWVQTAVGWSHEIFVFDASWTENGKAMQRGFCLRRDPGVGLLRELSSLEEQFKVLKALEKTNAPTPAGYWYEPDRSFLDAPFIVMEKVAGEAVNPWSKVGKQYYAEAAKRGKLPRSFVEALASLHNLDWRAAGLDFLGVPAEGKDFARREIAKWEGLINQSLQKPEPVLTEVICWLKEHAPAVQRLAFVHGAYRTGNLMIKDDEISAVIDWELQVIGDPMYDVAYVLSDLNREGSELLSNLVERDAFYRRYEAGTGIEIDDEVCRYYQLLYAMRTAAFWMSASGLFEDGRSDDLRLARTAWSIPVVLDRAARELGY
jgi:aminoglycoside phosphotransferase (APT) family kinase protein